MLQIIAAFRGADERIAAATAIFPTLPDPTALPALLAPLPPPQRDAVHGRLGLLAFFDVGNPTGRYHLDMAVPLHRVVLSRLVALSAQQGCWRADDTRRNLRNVIVGSKEVDVPDPTVFVVPRSGHIQVRPLHISMPQAACGSQLCAASPAQLATRPETPLPSPPENLTGKAPDGGCNDYPCVPCEGDAVVAVAAVGASRPRHA